MRPGPAPGRAWKALTAAAESRRLTANAALRAHCGRAIARRGAEPASRRRATARAPAAGGNRMPSSPRMRRRRGAPIRSAAANRRARCTPSSSRAPATCRPTEAADGRACAKDSASRRPQRSGRMDGPAIAIEEPHDVDADRRGLHFGQLAPLDEYRHRDVRLRVRSEEHEPRMRRQVEPAAAPLRSPGLASAIRGHAGRAEPVVNVVGPVDLLAHPLTNGLQVVRRSRHVIHNLALLSRGDAARCVAHLVHEGGMTDPPLASAATYTAWLSGVVS